MASRIAKPCVMLNLISGAGVNRGKKFIYADFSVSLKFFDTQALKSPTVHTLQLPHVSALKVSQNGLH